MSCDTIVLEVFDSFNLNECRNKAINILLEELKYTKTDYLSTYKNDKQLKCFYKKRRYYLRRKIRTFKKQKTNNIRTVEDIITISEDKSCYYFEGRYYTNFREELDGNVLFRMNGSHSIVLHSYDETCSFLMKFENNISAFKSLPDYEEILKFWKYHPERLIYVE